MFELTPWQTGKPVQAGWYIASTERNDQMRARWDGKLWSMQIDAAASDAAHDKARATPMPAERARRLEFRGLTERSHAWMTAELEHEPALTAH